LIFIFEYAVDEQYDRFSVLNFLCMRKRPTATFLMCRWHCVKDPALVWEITCPDVYWLFKVLPDVCVALELTAPSPSFPMSAVGRH